jgi:hypothetical protein
MLLFPKLPAIHNLSECSLSKTSVKISQKTCLEKI